MRMSDQAAVRTSGQAAKLGGTGGMDYLGDDSGWDSKSAEAAAMELHMLHGS